MNRAELSAALLVLAIGVALLAGALRFPFFLDGVPGPGFLPLLVSFGIVASGLALVVNTLRGRIGAEAPRWPPVSGWLRVALMLVSLFVVFLLLDLLGFLVVTTLFMGVMIFCLGERSWRMLATVPPLSAIALYAVFAVWLRVPLPKGIITFLD
jgi:putative tricarboxylic transport membrane protein